MFLGFCLEARDRLRNILSFRFIGVIRPINVAKPLEYYLQMVKVLFGMRFVMRIELEIHSIL